MSAGGGCTDGYLQERQSSIFHPLSMFNYREPNCHNCLLARCQSLRAVLFVVAPLNSTPITEHIRRTGPPTM